MVPIVEVLIVAGLHVPAMPFVETAGSEGATLFWHNGPTWLRVGVTCEVTVMLNVAVVAHCPADGVKVYVVVPGVLVLIVAGLHVPEIPFVDVTGRVGGEEFWQRAPTALNVGTIGGLIVMFNTAVVAH